MDPRKRKKLLVCFFHVGPSRDVVCHGRACHCRAAGQRDGQKDGRDNLKKHLISACTRNQCLTMKKLVPVVFADKVGILSDSPATKQRTESATRLERGGQSALTASLRGVLILLGSKIRNYI